MHKVIIDNVEYAPIKKEQNTDSRIFLRTDSLKLNTGNVALSRLPNDKIPVTMIIPEEFYDINNGIVNLGLFITHLNKTLLEQEEISIRYGIK